MALVVLMAAYVGVNELGWWPELGWGVEYAARPVTAEPASEKQASEEPGASGSAGAPADDGRILIRFGDPPGDDWGPGKYTYPTDQGFAPGKGLFDLLEFSVREKGDTLLFDLTFGAVTNPWRAPEGFFHQRVDIFIDAEPGKGRTTLVEEGANVRFCAEHPWDLWLRGEPWGGSAVLDADGRVLGDVPGGQVAAGVLSDGRTIRWQVAREVLGKTPQAGWWYYVLVGGYDTFGPSGYRVVFPERTEWFFGGGSQAMLHPNVIDLLAPARGPRSQRAQLSSYSVGRKHFATLYPVGGGRR